MTKAFVNLRMHSTNFKHIVPVLLLLLAISSCSDYRSNSDTAANSDTASERDEDVAANTATMTAIMQKHLDAVTNRDMETLASTMSPTGKMQLILPQSEIINSVEGFLDYHREWFKDTTWSFETKILNADAGNKLGMAITEVVYSEPERDGVPYFNRMTVSYVLAKQNDNWYVIKDHASTIEKSTD